MTSGCLTTLSLSPRETASLAEASLSHLQSFKTAPLSAFHKCLLNGGTPWSPLLARIHALHLTLSKKDGHRTVSRSTQVPARADLVCEFLQARPSAGERQLSSIRPPHGARRFVCSSSATPPTPYSLKFALKKKKRRVKMTF